MKPRGLDGKASWQRATPTYAYEKGPPSRMSELRAALDQGCPAPDPVWARCAQGGYCRCEMDEILADLGPEFDA